MRVLIMSFGTRGDIQPYAALASALAKAGHDVTLAIPEGFADLVPGAGPGRIDLHPAGSEMLRLVQEIPPRLRGAGDALKTLRVMTSAMRTHMRETWDAARAHGADVVIHHPKCLAGPHIAERLGVPAILSIPLPYYTPTRQHPLPFFGGASFGGVGNRATYGMNRLANVMYGGMMNEFRREIAASPDACGDWRIRCAAPPARPCTPCTRTAATWCPCRRTTPTRRT